MHLGLVGLGALGASNAVPPRYEDADADGELLSPRGGMHTGTFLVFVLLVASPLILYLIWSLVRVSTWLLWIFICLFMTLFRLVWSIWTVSHVVLDIVALSILKSGHTIYRKLWPR
jgi:hypothetical protein